jgi:hypothetical protein
MSTQTIANNRSGNRAAARVSGKAITRPATSTTTWTTKNIRTSSQKPARPGLKELEDAPEKKVCLAVPETVCDQRQQAADDNYSRDRRDP